LCERIIAALSEDPDFEYALIDGTIVKLHRHGAEARYGPPVCKCFRLSDLSSLHQRIRSQGQTLGSIAVAENGRYREVRFLGTIASQPEAVRGRSHELGALPADPRPRVRVPGGGAFHGAGAAGRAHQDRPTRCDEDQGIVMDEDLALGRRQSSGY
jgi:hypothetical protein